MSFLKYLLEDASRSLATTVSNELQPDYNNQPKEEIENPFIEVLRTYVGEKSKEEDIIKAAKALQKYSQFQDELSKIDLDKFAQILDTYNLEFNTNNRNDIAILFGKIGMVIKKYS